MLPRCRRLIAHGALAATIVALALSVPAPADARPPTDVEHRYVPSDWPWAPVPPRGMSSLSEREYLASRGLGAPRSQPAVAPADPGFDWASAGIGMAAAAAFIALALLAGLIVPPRRRRGLEADHARHA